MANTTISQGLIARLGANLNAYERGLRSAVRKAQAAGRDLQGAFRGASRRMRSLGKFAGVVALAIGGISVAAVKMASDFETAMAEVSTLLDDSLQGVGQLTSAVERLSLQYGVKLTEQARGLYQTISAGATEAASATQILEVANRAAVAGITDVATSVEAIMRVVNAYSLEADEAMRVSDGLFTVVKKGVTTFGELAPKIGQVAGTAATAGVQMEELFAIIATATKALPMEQVISGTNQLFLSFINRAADAEKVAKELNVQFDASALAAKGVHGVLGEVIGALGVGVDELQRIVGAGASTEATMGRLANRTGLAAEAIQALFPSVEALRVALALVKNDGADFTSQLQAQAEASGATDTAYRKMAATFGFLAKQVKQEVAAAFVALGNVLQPVARDAASAVGTLARKVREWVQANQDLLQQNVTRVFEAVIRGVGTAVEKIVTVVEFFKNNPIAGEFGIVGLVFLGPAGAAAFTMVGAVIDTIMGKIVGATDVAGRLQQNIDEAASRMQALQTEKAMGNLSKERVEEVNQELVHLSGVIEMNQRTLDSLGNEGKSAFDQIAEAIRNAAQAMQNFSLGNFESGFGGGGGGDESPTARMARDVESMRFNFEPIPFLVGEVSANLDTAAGRAARLRAELEYDMASAVEDLAFSISGSVGNALTDMLTGVRDVGDAVANLARAILRDVVGALIRATVQATILRSIMSAFGLPIPVPIPTGASGGIIPGRPHQPFPMVAHGGEVVLNRGAVAALGGPSSANRLNQPGGLSFPKHAMAALANATQAARAPEEVRLSKDAVAALAGIGQPAPVARASRLGPAESPSMPSSFSLVLPDPDQLPNPIDYGVIASKPAIIRLFTEMFRQARLVGAVR